MDHDYEDAGKYGVKCTRCCGLIMRHEEEFEDTEGKGKWMQHAVKHPGAFRRYCGGNVTSACIQRGLHSKDPTTRRRAALARTFRRYRGHHHHHHHPGHAGG